jgi:hypothetical protein
VLHTDIDYTFHMEESFKNLKTIREIEKEQENKMVSALIILRCLLARLRRVCSSFQLVTLTHAHYP